MVFERNEKERADKIMEQKLKILPQYFKAVQEGTKTFEIRENDRDYKVGDTLLLQERENELYPNAAAMCHGGLTGREITKEISYIYEGEEYGLKKGWCVLGLKQEGIVLKNIDLTGVSKSEQVKKVTEETLEFSDAFYKYVWDKTEDNKNHVIEELYDEFQSKLGLLEKEGIKAEEVQAYYNIWVRKLENRPRIKECKKCIIKADCKLWHSEHWIGEKEAETYIFIVRKYENTNNMYLESISDNRKHELWKIEFMEILGNIFENKDLIKKEV